MLVQIKRDDFNSMDDTRLIWTCIEPAILKIRGKSHDIKTDAYEHMTAGQRALLMFQIMYGHSRSGILEFYHLIPYLPSGKGIWQELRKSMQYFCDDSMLRLLDEMEADSEICTSTERLNVIFHETIPETIKLISAFIRKNPEEFIQFK